MHFVQEGYYITVHLVNADLRARLVNVARPEGRQKSSLPGCSLWNFMWRNILEISPFTLRLLFACGEQSIASTGSEDSANVPD